MNHMVFCFSLGCIFVMNLPESLELESISLSMLMFAQIVAVRAGVGSGGAEN